ncbi:uncharacterized protein LOC122038422 isoform X1 [Zingiber officinale]|uniref:uncharacterized protein LOC122038422 isoform X1 n=1 Tax=Zingiber officinale TaxID=94328 RepID=UPI001C4B2AB2|nr:uncharacterized protein LOC122038422 isoform X1 [Zingiber officinale]
MSSTLNSSNLALLHTTRFMRRTRSVVSCSSAASPSNCKQDSGGHAELLQHKIKFETLRGCKLGISRYPDFEYNAEGGIGTATAAGTGGDALQVSFDITTLHIPPLSGTTTKFLGLPLPPFLNIVITPELFQGTISRVTGKVELQFKANFLFSVGSIYKAPPLVVETVLTSEESKGTMREDKGEGLDTGGRCKLVGVAVVDRIDDLFMNSFLGLPTECIAILNAKISISGPEVDEEFKNC